MERCRGVAALLTTLAVLLAGAPGAGAAPSRSWPVTPETLGSVYGRVDPGGFTSLRTWEAGAWCLFQPTPDANVEANLDRLIARDLDQVAANGGTAIVTIGHPPPWVFDNHPIAVQRPAQWACGESGANVSIPSSASLRSYRDGSLSVQGQRWASYVARIVDYLTARYNGSMKVVLEVWNEPNLRSGINPGLGIPGAARSAKDAAKALHRYESIAYDVITAKGARGWLSLASSAIFKRWNGFVETYMRAHNRMRRIDSIHFNVYSFRGRGPDEVMAEWDRQAARVAKKMRRFGNLRRLPLRMTEANLNLINVDGVTANLRPEFASPEEQRRMATASQANAFFHGYSSVYWLVPWRQEQAAVFLRTNPGNVARDALVVLTSTLMGKQFASCKQRRKVRTCRFVAPDGLSTYLIWRNSGSSAVTAPRAGQLVEMTGATRPVADRERLIVGTTPIVLR